MTPANANKPCPICDKPASREHRPFCSKHCADLDLHRWLGGVYRVETDETPEDELRRERGE